MAIQRSGNFLSQQRLDVPHLKAIESGISFDFDALAGLSLSGKKSLVFKGLELNTAGVIGKSVSLLNLNVAGAVVWHYGASEAGTIFTIPDTEALQPISSTLNTNVSGKLVTGINFIGLDFYKTTDDSTSDLVKFIDADTNTETSLVVPLARTVKYKIVVSQFPFESTPNILPVAKVVVASGDLVESVTDCRPMFARLGSGGSFPSPLASFSWGSRTESNITQNSVGAPSPFLGEDKSISNLKDWMDSIMASIWELRGGNAWYSNVLRDNVTLTYGLPLLDNSDNLWLLDGHLIPAGAMAKSGTSVVTVTWANHPFTDGSVFKIMSYDANFALGTFTVISASAGSFTYDDMGAVGSFTSTMPAELQDTVAISGLSLYYENSGSPIAYKNPIKAGTYLLTDGQCLYADIDRNANTTLTPSVANLYSLSQSTIPGRRFILVWRDGANIFGRNKTSMSGGGGSVAAATQVSLGTVVLNSPPADPAMPAVITLMTGDKAEIEYDGAVDASSIPFPGPYHAFSVTPVGSTTGTIGLGGLNIVAADANTLTGFGGTGIDILGGTGNRGGNGIAATGGNGRTNVGGNGGSFTGGSATDFSGGTGVFARGGDGGTSLPPVLGENGGDAFYGTGGTGYAGGLGIRVFGGNALVTTGGDGVKATGGTSIGSTRDGFGVWGIGGSRNGYGVRGDGGGGDGVGVIGIGAKTSLAQSGHGVVGEGGRNEGGNAAGYGVVGVGGRDSSGGKAGGYFIGGSIYPGSSAVSNADGVIAIALDEGAGIDASSKDGYGVKGTSINDAGIFGTSTTGIGVQGQGGASNYGGHFTGGTNGVGVYAKGQGTGTGLEVYAGDATHLDNPAILVNGYTSGNQVIMFAGARPLYSENFGQGIIGKGNAPRAWAKIETGTSAAIVSGYNIWDLTVNTNEVLIRLGGTAGATAPASDAAVFVSVAGVTNTGILTHDIHLGASYSAGTKTVTVTGRTFAGDSPGFTSSRITNFNTVKYVFTILVM